MTIPEKLQPLVQTLNREELDMMIVWLHTARLPSHLEERLESSANIQNLLHHPDLAPFGDEMKKNYLAIPIFAQILELSRVQNVRT